MPGKPKIKFYNNTENLISYEEEVETTKSQKVGLYVDKQPNLEEKSKKEVDKKSKKKEKSEKVLAEEKSTKTQVTQKENKQKKLSEQLENQVIVVNENQSAITEQISFFEDEIKTDYKKAKRIAKKFFESSELLYDEFLKQNTKVRFSKKQVMENANLYVQALIVSKELNVNSEQSENNLEFTLEISFYANIFEQSKNISQLSQLAKTKLLSVPDIFMTAVLIDIKKDRNFSNLLYDNLKKLFMEIYPDSENDFKDLTKTLCNFLNKQGINV